MKQNYFPMDNRVAMDLFKAMIQEGNPPLGIPFAFEQPGENSLVWLGDRYSTAGTYSSTTWRDLFESLNLEKIDLRMKIDWIKTIKKHGKTLDDKIGSFGGIYSREEITTEWGNLSDFNKIRTRFRYAWINTGTELHDWTCEIGESLAEEYSDNKTNDWRLYESSGWRDDLLGEILEWNSDNDISEVYFSSESNDPGYYYTKKFTELDEYTELMELEDIYKESYSESDDMIFSLFGITLQWDHEREEIFALLAETIRELKESWITGNLTLTLNDDMPKSIHDFITRFESQELLPGFEDL